MFYPATFWPHKNHKYIIDTAIILKKKLINNFHFLFCGSDRGNFDFIKNEIEKNELNKLFTIIPFVSHEEVIFFYENVFGVVMPTTGGPTNLPLYESFFFKKPIFYTKDLLNDENLKKAIYFRNKRNVFGLDIKPVFPKKSHIVINNDFSKSIDDLVKELLTKIENLNLKK